MYYYACGRCGYHTASFEPEHKCLNCGAEGDVFTCVGDSEETASALELAHRVEALVSQADGRLQRKGRWLKRHGRRLTSSR